MAYRHQRSKVLSVLAASTMVNATFYPVECNSVSGWRRLVCLRRLRRGFSEIVKAVTPAVVNIAVTGGGEGRREGRRQLPPGGPFGGRLRAWWW